MSPNYSVFNNQSEEPLLVRNVESVINRNIVTTPASASAVNGDFYAVSSQSQSVVANGFLLFQLTNPANSNKTIYIHQLSGGATTNTTIDILLNATFAATGTSRIPVNSNLGSAKTSSMNSKFLAQGTDPTTSGTLYNSYIQLGGLIILEYDGSIIIPSTTSARTLYVRLINNSNQINILSINVSWWELTP